MSTSRPERAAAVPRGFLGYFSGMREKEVYGWLFIALLTDVVLAMAGTDAVGHKRYGWAVVFVILYVGICGVMASILTLSRTVHADK